jgi:hypothetical protein
MDKNSINFLGIGVQKSASSWLWSILKEHDDIWMPPRKELHYFDRSLCYPSPSFLATDKLIDRLSSDESHNKIFKNRLTSELGSKVDRREKNIKWYSNYFLGTYNDEWYVSLFEDGEGKVKGEFTPAYSILNKKDIEHIHTLFPSLKVILILRNPIERAWSQARFYMTRNSFNINSDVDKLKEFIDSDIQMTRGDYINIINNWSSIFSKENLFIGFYDEIEEDNQKFISKVCDFLEIKKENILKNDILNKKINVSIEMEIPKEIKNYLIDKYWSEVEMLSKTFSYYPSQWLSQYRNFKLNY